MSHADIQKVKFSLDRNIGNRVKISANRGRHKIDEAEGVISETYPSIFLIEVFNKADDTTQKISFSYTDVLTRTVEVEVFDGNSYSPLIPPIMDTKEKREIL